LYIQVDGGFMVSRFGLCAMIGFDFGGTVPVGRLSCVMEFGCWRLLALDWLMRPCQETLALDFQGPKGSKRLGFG
jgi:hypothetical protein